MSGEIEVPETPNWLNDLEAKREVRLKARLGHEAGAGAPCLKCGDKCPGLDLHFWRKACKVCRCSKEEHDVPDDDIYGWAQFQLLGSKPNKIKTKIVLPGKNDEVELEWAPKGQKDTIDKYLKTLPPEALPVKGSQAAQERKQLLQKQIPVHDIDPALCHELNEEEVTKMEEYLAHIKKSSVGVGQIVNLSSVIKANLHNISPHEAHIIASRYQKGVPFSEIVKLQIGLAQNLEKLTLNNKNQSVLPSMQPNKPLGGIKEENVQHALAGTKFKDIAHPWYTNSSPGKGPLNPQYAETLQRPNDYAFNEKLLQGTNFDPSKTPSQFMGYNTPGYRPVQYGHGQEAQENIRSTSVPYGKMSVEETQRLKPNFSRNVQQPDQCGFENPYFNQNNPKSNTQTPIKRDLYSETQDPKAPKSVKDLIYSTYDPSKGPIPQDHYENSGPNRNVDSKMHGYDPNVVFNTYKHDPSVIKHETLSLGDTNDPTNKSIHKFDPITGKPIAEDCGLAEFGGKPYPYGTDDSSLAKFDPVTGKIIPENRPFSSDEFRQRGAHELPKFDPVTGEPIPEDYRYPEFGGKPYPYGTDDSSLPKFDHVTGKLIPENRSYGSDEFRQRGAHELPKFDPVTGKPIPEDYRYPEFGMSKQYPYETNNSSRGPPKFDAATGKPFSENQSNDLTQRSTHELPKFDPVTGKPIPQHYRYPECGTGKQYKDTSYGPPKFDVITGRVISENPLGTRPISEDQRHVEVGPQRKEIVDPRTGKYISEDKNSGASNMAERIKRFDNNSDPSPAKSRKPLSAMQPGHINVPEDYLEPHMVNVGSIQDINPVIRAATAELNPGFDKDCVYGDNNAEYSPESIREILNNIKLPDCHYCKKAFDENEFAVSIDRADMLFHAQCFKCAGCNQSLADNIYFYHKETNNVYCGRDYAKIKGYPRCTACDELIFTKEYCLAENATFHLKHFCCFQCDTPLAGQDYTLEEDKPYCLPCYETSKAAKCSTCEKVIKPDEVGCQLNGVHFHAEDRCFRCIVCSLPLMGKKLLLRNEKLYCSHDCFNTGKK